MTHAALNDLVLTVALLLECALLALLVARGIARKLPVFTALLAFYLLRSTLLLAIFGHVASADYLSAFDRLAVVDLLLQALVAIEIAVNLARATGGSASSRRGVLFLPPVVALATTSLLAWILPANLPIPLDRIQAFDWMWLIVLGFWALTLPSASRAEQPAPRRIALGFAFYGAAGILATSNRTLAALHRDAQSFTVWSYALPAVWLLVVAYWTIALYRRFALNPAASEAEDPGIPCLSSRSASRVPGERTCSLGWEAEGSASS